MSEKFFRKLAPSTVREIAKALDISLRNKSEEDLFELVTLHYMEDNAKFWEPLNLKVLSSIAADIGLPLMGGEEADAISYMIQNIITTEESEESESEEEEFKPESLTQDEEGQENLDEKLDSAIGLEVDDISEQEEDSAKEGKSKTKEEKSPETVEMTEEEKNQNIKSKEETGGNKEKTMSLKANLRKLRGRSEEGRAIKDKIIKTIHDISTEVEGNVDIFTDGYYYETYELRIPGSKIRFFFLANKHNEAPIRLRAFSIAEKGQSIGDSSSELMLETFESLNDDEIKAWLEERINYFAEEGLKLTDQDL